MAAAEVGKELLWFKKLFSDLKVFKEMKTFTVSCDNQSCIKLIKNPILYKRCKHIDVRYHFIRDLIKREELTFEYCNTKDMVADILTKALTRVKVDVCLEGMGLKD